MSKILLFPMLLLLAFSCSEEEKKVTKKKSNFDVPTDYSFQKNAVSLISSQKNIIAYGCVKMNQLLTNGIVNSELGETPVVKYTLKDIEKFADYIDFSVPIYYAIQSQAEKEKVSSTEPVMIFFGRTKKNIDEWLPLINKLYPNIQVINSDENKFICLNDGVITIATHKDQFILRYSEERSSDSIENTMNQLIESLNSNTSLKEIEEHYVNPKDILLVTNNKELTNMVQNIFPTLPIASEKEDLIRSSSINLSFEKGEVKMLVKTNCKEKMKEFEFFEDDAIEVIEKLGKGNPIAGIVANINVEEVERFRKEYYPKSISNQLNNCGIPKIEEMIPDRLPIIEALIIKYGIKNYIDGQMGAVLFPKSGLIPPFNLYMGIGPKLNEITDIDDFHKKYISKLCEVSHLDSNCFYGYNSSAFKPDGTHKIETDVFESFGAKPISGFIDFTEIEITGLLTAFDRNLAVYEELLGLIDIITMEFDIYGGNFSIYLSDKNKNALTQIMDFVCYLPQEKQLQLINLFL